MSKNLNVSLAFTANTNEAIASIKNLQKELNSLSKGSSLKNSGITQLTPQIQQATVAAGELQATLEQAVNTKTGKLDLTQFSRSLKQSGKTLSNYATELSALGPKGQQAFANLTQAIIMSEAPLIRCNSRLKEFATTLANTARWQFSSSILHGFMGAVQSAYGYAQDLNESLNNIRIVTGKNTDQMAKFAVEANKAAKALSTTTTRYTDASLIYFQQGLSAKEVKERADITIKMANVSKQSAQVVSDQLTAVWNNFYDGSKSLEYYADVMTNLGAATASSADEISEGLNKFAAAADTVGLSYDYAATALATVTATTRESAEVVGTAFKTLFSRIQDLELGKTLDDGTTLGKYSAALKVIGVDIKDANGDLKDMDTILTEMGNKWSSLSKDTQVATAQAVAGTRQYTQLIALMDNWEYFQKNLNVTQSSVGALQKQADIYAESWEAARDRVTASAEEIYGKILDDDFFIDFLDGFSKVIDGVSNLIDSFGGLKGVLLAIGSIVTQLFQKSMAQGIRNIADTVIQLTPLGVKREQEAKRKAIIALQSMRSNSAGGVGAVENTALSHEAQMQEALLNVAKNLTDEELKQLQLQMDNVRAMDERAVAAAKLADAAKNELEALQSSNRILAKRNLEVNAENEGRAAAGKRILAMRADTQQQHAFGDWSNYRNTVIDEAYGQAQNKVRSAHNLSSDDNLSAYEDEVFAAFTRMLKSVAEKMDAENGGGNNYSSAVGALHSRIVAPEIVNASRGISKQVEHIEGAQQQTRLAGRLSAQGQNLSNLGTSLRMDENETNSAVLDSVYNQLSNRLTKASKAAEELKEAIPDIDEKKKIDLVRRAIKDLQERLAAAKGDAKGLSEILGELKREGGLGEQIDDAGLAAYGDVQSTLSNELPDVNLHEEYDRSMAEERQNIVLENRQADTEESLNRFNQKLNAKSPVDWANGISQAASAIMSVGAAISSVQGLIDIFNNPDASGWDKISATFTTLGMILPTVTSFMRLFGKESFLAGVAASIGWGPIIAIIAAIVAVIGLAVVAFDQLQKEYNKDAIAAKKATDAANELAEAYENAKQAHENLIESIKEYQDAKHGLDQLTRGTQEYREALDEANESALNLIKNANLIKGEDYDIVNGEIVIKDSSLSQAETESEKKAIQAASAARMANATAEELRQKNLQTNMIRDDDVNVWDYILARGAEGAMETGMLASTITLATGGTLGLPALIATAAGAIAGGIGGLIEATSINQANNRNQEEQLNKLIEEYKTKGEEALTTENIHDLGFMTANQAYVDSIREVVRATDQAAKQMALSAELSAAAFLDTQTNLSQSKNAAEIYGAAGRIYLNKIEETKTKYKDSTSESIWDAYKNQVSGLNGFQEGKIEKDRVNYSYIDENNKVVEVAVSKEAMIAALATNNAEANLKEAAEKLAAAFAALEKSGNEAAEGLKQVVAYGNLDKATFGDYDKLVAKTDTDEEMQELTADWAAYGYKSQQEMIDAINASIANAKTAWGNYKNGQVFSDMDLGQGFVEQMSLGAAKGLETQLEKIKLGPLGEEGGKDYINGLNKILESDELSTDEYTAALEALTQVDWSDWDAMEQVKTIMAEFGVEIDISSGYWKNFAEKMRDASNSIPDFSRVKQDLIEINTILKDLSFGSTIKEDDYQALIKLKKEWEKFFILQADGTRKFIGNEEEMKNATQDTLRAYQAEMAKNRTYAEGIKTAGVTVRKSDAETEIAAGGDGKDGLFNAQNLELYGFTVGADGNFTKGGNTYTQKEASAIVMAQQRAKDTRDLINNNEDVKGILENSAYAESYDEILTQAEAGNDERLKEMLAYLEKVVTQDYEKLGAEYQEMLASTATSLADLDKLSTTDNFDPEARQKALISLASTYEDCRGEVDAYKKALASGNPQQIEDAEKKLRQALTTSEWRNASKAIMGYYEAMENAIDVEEKAQQRKLIADEVNKLWGTNITSDFVEQKSELFDEWAHATGDRAVELALEIQAAAMIASTNVSELFKDMNLEGDQLTSTWNAVQQVIKNNPIKPNGDFTGLLQQLSNLGLEAATVQAILMSLGQGKAKITLADGTIKDVDLITAEGLAVLEDALKNGLKSALGFVPDVGDDKPKIQLPKTKDYRKSQSEMMERYKENNDLLEENTRAMNEANAAADRLWGDARLAEMEKVNAALEEQIDLYTARAEEAQGYLESDKNALITSAAKLKHKNGSSIGTLEFNSETGNITNYTEFMTALRQERESRLTSYGTTLNEAEKKELEEFDKLIADFEKKYKDYEGSNDEAKNAEEKRKQAIRDWQDNNFEQITYKLEFEIEVNDKNLELINYYLDRMTSKFHNAAEAMALYQQTINEYDDSLSHYKTYFKNLLGDYYGENAAETYESLTATDSNKELTDADVSSIMSGYQKALDRGEISPEKFREGMDKLRESLMSSTQALEEQKQTLQDYYGNVMSMALEEIGLYTAEMEQLNSVLDHYSSILDLIGKKQDYASKNNILRSKASNLQNEYQVQSDLYEKSVADADYWFQEMQKATTENQKETYKKNWQAAQEAANEAQDQMLSKTQEWAEVTKQIIENEFAKMGEDLSKALAGGTSLDELLTTMERRSSLQEEYLTTTNKIYETNKLMRQAQQEIDKTSNTVAKRRLQSFINETNQMQNQNKLSQYELDIQQAKYDLLLAEIALEEAQNAKSTVRLQRDAEGNFGYVYTADSNAVADAEQKMADAQNKLYNIGLDGANDYAQKYAETLQESQDAITELTTMWMNGEIATEEEFNRRKTEIVEYYGEKLRQYSSLQTTALSVDSRIAEEAWSSEFMNIATSVEGWQSSVTGYFANAKTQMVAWDNACKTVADQSGLADLGSTLEEVDNKSASLFEILMGKDDEPGVTDAMWEYVSAAKAQMDENIELQKSIDATKEHYDSLLSSVTKVVEQMQLVESPKFNETNENNNGVASYQKGTLTWTGNGDARVWTDSEGKTYTANSTIGQKIQAAFKAAKQANGGYTGDYFIKWNSNGGVLNADELHKKYGLATGGYTGDWEGAYGKLAFLHQKELVLNASDTENFLASMEVLERILRVIDLHSANSQIGGLLSSPVYRGHNNESVIQQDVRIEANFPSVTDRNEIEEAFNNLVNQASQYANRK